MRLRTKLAIALLVVTVVLSGATFGGLELYKQQQISEVRSDIDESARLAAEGIGDNIAQQRNQIGYVASRPEAADFGDASQYASDFRAANQEAALFAVQIIAANGTMMAFEGEIREEVRREAIGSDVSDAAYFQCAMEREQVCTGDVEYANATDQHFVTISAPIRGPAENDGDGNDIEGVFTAAVYINERSFVGPASPLGKADQGQRVEVVREGTTLYSSGAAAENVSGAIVATHQVPDSDWQVRLARDTTSLNRELQFLGIAQGVGLFLVLSSVVGFGYWQYNTSMRQAERLLRAFERVETGDYEANVKLTAGEEWEDISDGFNKLTLGLKQREEALRERQQRLEVLYRVIRHNIRNEMSVVINYADIIADMSENEQIQGAATTVVETGRKLNNLSEKARQIQNALEETEGTRVIDVESTVHDVVSDVSEEYPDVPVDVDVDAGGDEGDGLPEVSALPALEMALENVVENACKHNDADDPFVEVESRFDESADRVRIAVRDNGPGIPEQERNVLREGRETALQHGSGLGLWLVYWVVDKSDGELEIADREPRGSVVTMEIPVATEAELAEAAADEGAEDENDDPEPETQAFA